ncbi:hypothetical protein F4778DRAFT_780990 [Xylariomycetidae sp. FL2044]|nr:hypothetical protein F4778DRAFT_780990 [Xylariomycetidae sp. FL2044]
MHISSSTKNIGRTHSLLSPTVATSVSLDETCLLLNAAGYEVRLTKYSAWLRQAAEEQRHDGPLAPVMPILEETVLGRLTRLEVSQYSPFYDSRNTVEALKDRGISSLCRWMLR